MFTEVNWSFTDLILNCIERIVLFGRKASACVCESDDWIEQVEERRSGAQLFFLQKPVFSFPVFVERCGSVVDSFYIFVRT